MGMWESLFLVKIKHCRRIFTKLLNSDKNAVFCECLGKIVIILK